MKEPILLKDLIDAAHKLPNPNTFPLDEVAIPIKDTLNKTTRSILFRKRSRISAESVENYWIIFHTIAIK